MQAQESVEMTRPVVTRHEVAREDSLGNYEDQEMCFYLPAQYQGGHTHASDTRAHECGPGLAAHDCHNKNPRHRRHEAQQPPPPMGTGRVYLVEGPAMYVFAR